MQSGACSGARCGDNARLTRARGLDPALLTSNDVPDETPRRDPMDAVTKQKPTADEHSHHVRPADMEWQKTRFPGCEAKTLLFDPSTGLVTALMRFAPGATLPDHEH